MTAFRIGPVEERPVALLAHALEHYGGVRLQPDRHAIGAAVLARLVVHVGPAAHRQHRRPAAQKPRHDALLAFAKIRLAVLGEDLRDAEIGGLLDLGVGIEEREMQEVGEPPADGRLAGAHHADQHDAAFAEAREHAVDLLAVGGGLARFHDFPPRGWCSAARAPVKVRPQRLAIAGADGLDGIGEDADRCLALFDYWLFSD